MKVRRTIALLVSALVVAIVAIVAAPAARVLWFESSDHSAERTKAKDAYLAQIAVDSSQGNLRALAEASEGGFIVLDNGDWIGIIYHCRHCRHYDLALYVDSHGNILESHVHFCGNLGIRTKDYQHAKKEFSAFPNEQDLKQFGGKRPKDLHDKQQKWLHSRNHTVLSIIAGLDDIDAIVEVLCTFDLFTAIRKSPDNRLQPSGGLGRS